MDANDALNSSDASRDYDPESKLATITTRIWALNFSREEFNPDTMQILETLSGKVPAHAVCVQPGKSESHGHLTMAHPSVWASHVAYFMKLADATANIAPGR